MIVDLNSFKDFVVGVEKMISKPKWIGIHAGDGICRFFVSKDSKQVTYSVPGEFTPLDVAVEGAKFLAAVKNWSGPQIDFTLGPKSAKFEYENTKAQFPYAEQEASWVEREYSEYYPPDNFLDSLEACLIVPDTDARFWGILLDPTDFGTVVTKLSGSLIYIQRMGSSIVSERRVIPVEFGKLAKSRYGANRLLLSDRVFGVRLDSGVEITSSYLSSTFPEDYLRTLGLSAGENLVDINTYDFGSKFDVSLLSAGVKLVSSVIGEEENGIKLEALDSNMWKLSAKTYKNFSVEEYVTCQSVIGSGTRSMWLHKKSFLQALSVFDSEVYLYDNQNGVVLTDDRQVVLLSKIG